MSDCHICLCKPWKRAVLYKMLMDRDEYRTMTHKHIRADQRRKKQNLHFNHLQLTVRLKSNPPYTFKSPSRQFS